MYHTHNVSSCILRILKFLAKFLHGCSCVVTFSHVLNFAYFKQYLNDRNILPTTILPTVIDGISSSIVYVRQYLNVQVLLEVDSTKKIVHTVLIRYSSGTKFTNR